MMWDTQNLCMSEGNQVSTLMVEGNGYIRSIMSDEFIESFMGQLHDDYSSDDVRQSSTISMSERKKHRP